MVVDSLYGDRLSFLIGGLAIVAAAALTAVRTGEAAIWACTIAMIVLTLVRLSAFELFLTKEGHADRHPLFWKRLYSGLGILHLATIGVWTMAVFWTSQDHFSELLSVMAALAFLIGTQGRNFSSPSLIHAQLIACLVPMLFAFSARSPVWSVSLTLFLIAFYAAVIQTSARIRAILQQAIEASEENWRLAHTDGLTGLANGVSMRLAIQRAIAEHQPFSLLMVDLDRFKRVNETLGHVAGNEFLRKSGAEIARIARSDALVSRESGDDFCILFLNRGEARNSVDMAEAIIERLSAPLVVNGATMPSACSIGIAQFPADASTYEELSHRADLALHEAKSRGGGALVEFRPGTPDRAADRLRLENDLRHALKTGAIELHFQPIVANRTFEVVGCEGLARWTHPTRGSISPGEFLPVAEDAGLMRDLTDQTFRAGCRAASRWPEAVSLSINLSPDQLRRPDLLDMISGALAESGLPASRLEIEITENSLVDDRPDIVETMRRISELGICLSLDDFGTGYSNLGQIANLPIDKIKLDKSFLKGIAEDKRRAALLRGAVNFIAPLGLTVVLEGVETEAQREFAASLEGIKLLQGYAFGAPMPEALIGELLSRASTETKGAGGRRPSRYAIVNP